MIGKGQAEWHGQRRCRFDPAVGSLGVRFNTIFFVDDRLGAAKASTARFAQED